MKRLILVIAWSAFAAVGRTASLAAQQPVPPAPAAPRDSTARVRLETQLRQRFARAVRQRLGLTDEQMTRLQQVSAKYEQQRRPLALEEQSARLQLRGLMIDEARADQKQVEVLLGRMIDIQKRRAAILETEQRDLSAFMTPIQRAKYLAMQEQVRRRVQQMRERRMQGGRGSGFGPARGRPGPRG